MYKKGRAQFIPFVVTIVGIVFTDLLVGIGLGMLVAIFHILWNNYRTPYHFDPNTHVQGQLIHIQLSEDVSFLNKAGIMHTLNQIPDGSSVVIDASNTKTIHLDVLEIIEDFVENAKTRDIAVKIEGMTDDEVHNPVEQFGRAILSHAAVEVGAKSNVDLSRLN